MVARADGDIPVDLAKWQTMFAAQNREQTGFGCKDIYTDNAVFQIADGNLTG
jgi:hypothetical protein